MTGKKNYKIIHKKKIQKNIILFRGRDGESYTIAGMGHTHSKNLDRQKKPPKNKIQKKLYKLVNHQTQNPGGGGFKGAYSSKKS